MNTEAMSEVKDLRQEDAVKKLREIVGHNATCMFHTRHTDGTLASCPMMVREVDDLGNMWFLSGRSTEKNAHLAAYPHAMFTITDNAHSEYLVVHADVSIVDDRARKEELWTAFAKAWFPQGVDDPELTLLKAVPSDCQYWDTVDGKLVQLVKIAGAALTGKPNDSGSVSGRLQP